MYILFPLKLINTEGEHWAQAGLPRNYNLSEDVRAATPDSDHLSIWINKIKVKPGGDGHHWTENKAPQKIQIGHGLTPLETKNRAIIEQCSSMASNRQGQTGEWEIIWMIVELLDFDG